MPFTNYFLRVTGPLDGLLDLKARLDAGLYPRCGDDGDYTLHLQEENWGDWHEEHAGHRSVWAHRNGYRDPANDQFVETGTPATIDPSGLYLGGRCRYVPPVDLAERISAIYPRTAVYVSANAEDVFVERWESVGGVSRRVEAADLDVLQDREKPLVNGPLAEPGRQAPLLDEPTLEALRGRVVLVRRYLFTPATAEAVAAYAADAVGRLYRKNGHLFRLESVRPEHDPSDVGVPPDYLSATYALAEGELGDRREGAEVRVWHWLPEDDKLKKLGMPDVVRRYPAGGVDLERVVGQLRRACADRFGLRGLHCCHEGRLYLLERVWADGSSKEGPIVEAAFRWEPGTCGGGTRSLARSLQELVDSGEWLASHKAQDWA